MWLVVETRTILSESHNSSVKDTLALILRFLINHNNSPSVGLHYLSPTTRWQLLQAGLALKKRTFLEKSVLNPGKYV